MTVTADTTDLGTGVASIAYSLDGGAATPYKAPVRREHRRQPHDRGDRDRRRRQHRQRDHHASPSPRPPARPCIEVDVHRGRARASPPGWCSAPLAASATPARSITLTNTGASDLVISDVVIAGTNPNQFSLADGQPTSFTVPPASRRRCRPGSRLGFSFGVNTATMTLTTNDPLNPTYVVALRGVNAGGTVGDTEPSLSELVSTLGYSTVTGVNGTYQATTRAPVGDEVVAPYFKRVDTSKPVGPLPGRPLRRGDVVHLRHRLRADEVLGRPHHALPLPGRHASTTPPTTGSTRRRSPRTRSSCRRSPPAGRTPGTRRASSGCAANYANFTDDQFNRAEDGHHVPQHPRVPGQGRRRRGHPEHLARRPSTSTCSTDKNFDYQDQVMLLTNATPELTAAASPGSGATDAGLRRPARRHGARQGRRGHRVLERAAQHRQVRSTGRPLLDLTGGTLRITSTAGKSSGASNNQDNALQLHVDASRSDVTVEGRILGPMSDLTAGYQQKAVWFGPDQNNYLKVEIEHRTDTPGVYITVFKEEKGVTSTIAQIPVVDPSARSARSTSSIVGDMDTGTLQASYRINSSSDAYTPLGSGVRPDQPDTVVLAAGPGRRARLPQRDDDPDHRRLRLVPGGLTTVGHRSSGATR